MGGSGDRFQVRLRDLAMAVVGSAFVLDVARRSRAAWGGGAPDPGHAVGLGVLGLAVAVALVVAGRRSRGLRAGDRPASRGARGFALAWRAAAVAWLAGSIAEVAWVLQEDRAALLVLGVGRQAVDLLRAEARLDIVPFSVALGAIGLILAASPARARRAAPSPSRARAAWPSVVWAGLAGVAILGIGYGAIPYLILLALEAVSNAMTRTPMVPRPTFNARLDRVALEASAVALACLATAAWLAEDLRLALRDPARAREPRSRAGVLARSATALLAAIGAPYLLLVALPALHPNLAEGIWMIVDPMMAATIALAFAGLAAGIAARGSASLAEAGSLEAPATATPRRIWPGRILRALGCLVAAEVAAAAFFEARADLARPWFVPLDLQECLYLVRHSVDWLGGMPSVFGNYAPLERPGLVLLILAAPWIAARLLALIAGGPAGPPPALDTVAADPLARRRFLGSWAALTAVLLAALPTIFLGGLVLLHEFLRRAAG